MRNRVDCDATGTASIGYFMFLPALWTVMTVAASAFILARMLAHLRRSGTRFNFRITDLYAAVLCLSPVMAWLGYSIENLPEREYGIDRYFFVWLCGTSLLNMVLGLAVGRIDIQLPPHDRTEPTVMESAISILVGSFYGLMLSLIFLIFLFYFLFRMASRLQEVDGILRKRESVVHFRRPGG